MAGGTGSDTFHVNETGDTVTELPGGGIDLVLSSIRYVLPDEIEKLTLTGAANINGIGNALANTMTGNTGANTLWGNDGNDVLNAGNGNDVLKGGSGNDTLNGGAGNDDLAGGAGNDEFLFNIAPDAATNVDDIVDFNIPDDQILLSTAVFSDTGAPGTLAADAFFSGAAAHDPTDRIIYDSATGALNHDPDGSGPVAAIQFAELSTGLGLANADFTVL